MAEEIERTRLLSLDVFRGITVAGMVLVNNPGNWSAIYAPLEHAEWHGATPTDFIFPFDIKGWRTWTKPFVIFGTNALALFVGSGVMARLLGLIKIGTNSDDKSISL